jgi:glutamate-1-semialdehyde aminotransferase
VLDALADGSVLKGIHELGGTLMEELASARERHGVGSVVTVSGEPERAVVGFAGDQPLVTKSWVQQCFAEDGILFNGSMFICARHSDDDIARTVASFDRALAVIARGDDLRPRLKGDPVQPVFRAP